MICPHYGTAAINGVNSRAHPNLPRAILLGTLPRLPPPLRKNELIEAVVHIFASSPHKRFLVGCSSPFMRLATDHPTFRFALGASTQCLASSVKNPPRRPSRHGIEMRGSMVIRLRLRMISSTPPPPPPPPLLHENTTPTSTADLNNAPTHASFSTHTCTDDRPSGTASLLLWAKSAGEFRVRFAMFMYVRN